MPQLMPLNWIFSSMMVFLLIMSAGVIYSEKMMVSKVDLSLKDLKSSMNIWCW